MKIQLPNGERLVLDNNLGIEQKKELAWQMTMEWDDAICSNWESEAIIFFLDGLANYLTWHKEEDEKNKQDKEVLSIKRIEQMTGKRKAMSIPFSSLTAIKRELLGLEVQKGGQ